MTIAIKERSEEQIVEAAQNGHLESFGALYQRYYSSMVALAYSVLGDRDSAEDAAQEVFAIACRQLTSLRHSNKFGDWLGCFSEHTAKFLSFETLSKGWTHLKAAEQAVQDHPDLRFRVQVDQLPVMYVFMMRWDEMRDAAKAAKADWPMPESIQETYDRFVEIAKKKNITRLNEGQEGYGPLDEALKRAKK